MISEPASISKLEDNLIDLQSQLAFQEDTVQTLNKVVIEQQGQIERLNEMLTLLKQQVDQAQFDAESGSQLVDEKPPHY